MTYPYAGRDLFAEPESYAYAQCDDAAYLNEWKASRDAAKAALVARAGEDPEPDRIAEEMISEDAIPLSSLLKSELISSTTLDPFIVKYEVFGRLFAWYQEDGRRHPESSTADLGTYILFAERLCEHAETSGSLKPLSTLLKLCDALASQPPGKFEPREADRLVNVIEREALFVDGVAGRE